MSQFRCFCRKEVDRCLWPQCPSVTGHPALSTREHHHIERHFRQDALDFWIERATDDALGALIDCLETGVNEDRNDVCLGNAANIPRPMNESGFIHMSILQDKLCATCGKQPRMKWQAYCHECYRAWRKVYRKEIYDQETQRGYNLRAHFGITLDEYNQVFFRQGGCCAICGKQEEKVNPKSRKVWPLRVDHNHRTGDIRELLCGRCNTLVGYIEADRGIVQKVTKYLKKHDR